MGSDFKPVILTDLAENTPPCDDHRYGDVLTAGRQTPRRAAATPKSGRGGEGTPKTPKSTPTSSCMWAALLLSNITSSFAVSVQTDAAGDQIKSVTDNSFILSTFALS